MYHKKTEHQLTWLETRQDVALALRQLAARIQNEVLAELDAEFVALTTAGKIVNFELDKSELVHRFAAASKNLDKNFSKIKEIGGVDAAV